VLSKIVVMALVIASIGITAVFGSAAEQQEIMGSLYPFCEWTPIAQAASNNSRSPSGNVGLQAIELMGGGR
jgi:hypothetical protein